MPFEKILIVLTTIVGVIMAAYTLYYVIIALNFNRKIKPYPETNKFNKFAILIAARNEEAVIGELVHSLKDLDYPQDRYEITVIPNNCTDDTKGAAIAAGANVYECKLPVKNKGDVLNQTINMYMGRDDIDAFIIFDADNIVDSQFLKEMNKALDSGDHVAMGFRDSKNPTETYMSSAYSVFYMVVNIFYNKPRMVLGMNSLISGTGFMTSKEVIKKIGGWETHTITEDVEHTIQASLANEHIAFVPTAILYDEQPTTLSQSWHQRIRWSVGSQQNLKLYGKPTFIDSFKKKGKDSLDMFIMLIATHMQIMTLIASAIALVTLFFTVSFKALVINMAIMLFGMFLFPTLVGFFAINYMNKPIKPMLKGIFSFWFFLLSWMPIHLIALFKKRVTWREIKHKPTTEIE